MEGSPYAVVYSAVMSLPRKRKREFRLQYFGSSRRPFSSSIVVDRWKRTMSYSPSNASSMMRPVCSSTCAQPRTSSVLRTRGEKFTSAVPFVSGIAR